MIGRSTSAVQAIELGKLVLSQDLAAKIEDETGVNAGWLLDGDVNRPIENRAGASYREDDFELARARKSKLPAHIDETSMEMCHVAGLLNGERLGRVFAAAVRAKPSKFQVAMFLANQWLEEMEQKFGEPSDDYLEYRIRVTVSRTDNEGHISDIHAPMMTPRVAALHEANFLRSLTEKHGQDYADKIAATFSGGKNSNRKRKKAGESSKTPP